MFTKTNFESHIKCKFRQNKFGIKPEKCIHIRTQRKAPTYIAHFPHCNQKLAKMCQKFVDCRKFKSRKKSVCVFEKCPNNSLLKHVFVEFNKSTPAKCINHDKNLIALK